METIDLIWHQITDSETIVRSGLWVVSLIVFLENGAFFAFFLPGDYLLFLTGVFGGTMVLKEPLSEIFIYIYVASILGSTVGFLSGRYAGSRLENMRDNWFFKKRYLDSTRKFFDKHGLSALIISRFLPIIRTFTPILAGIIKMPWLTYLLLSLLGGFFWVSILVVSGYYLGQYFPWIVNYVQYIILFFLFITTFTVIKGYISIRNDRKL